jgi:hypothetical protein
MLFFIIALFSLSCRGTEFGYESDCSFCQYVVVQVAYLLAANKTESGIIGTLNALCAFLPNPVSQNKVCLDYSWFFSPNGILLLAHILVLFLREEFRACSICSHFIKRNTTGTAVHSDSWLVSAVLTWKVVCNKVNLCLPHDTSNDQAS